MVVNDQRAHGLARAVGGGHERATATRALVEHDHARRAVRLHRGALCGLEDRCRLARHVHRDAHPLEPERGERMMHDLARGEAVGVLVGYEERAVRALCAVEDERACCGY